TPIAASLRAVADDLREATGPRVVVLVTDGEETCGGDPRAEIEALVAQGIDVRVNIVGFAVEDAGLKDTFRAWAEAGHGSYFDAADETELTAAVEAAASMRFKILDGAGAVVGSGSVGAAPVPLSAGTYRVEVGDKDPFVFENVVVEPSQLTRLDYSGG
ncbi:MAG: vWA domain-containing protein, partial [Devosia sp.]